MEGGKREKESNNKENDFPSLLFLSSEINCVNMLPMEIL